MTTLKNMHFMMQCLFVHRLHSASIEFSTFVPSLDIEVLVVRPECPGVQETAS